MQVKYPTNIFFIDKYQQKQKKKVTTVTTIQKINKNTFYSASLFLLECL